MRSLILLCVAAAVGIAFARSEGRDESVPTWPGRPATIPVYSGAPEYDEALQRAMTAWNASGAAIRFELAAHSEGQLDVRLGTKPCAAGVPACADIGHVRWRRNEVWIAAGLDPRAAAHLLTHELGHALGLDHQERSCAAMNPGRKLCPLPPPGHWGCRLLERDDVERAVRLYGGEVLPIMDAEFCAVVSS